jgi:hypothetical protein
MAASCFSTATGISEDEAGAAGAADDDFGEPAATAEADEEDMAKSSKRVVATSRRLMRLASEWNSDIFRKVWVSRKKRRKKKKKIIKPRKM